MSFSGNNGPKMFNRIKGRVHGGHEDATFGLGKEWRRLQAAILFLSIIV